jgi:hypothetical protein
MDPVMGAVTVIHADRELVARVIEGGVVMKEQRVVAA